MAGRSRKRSLREKDAERFKDVIESRAFQQAVRRARQSLEIPEEGFSEVDDTSRAWLNSREEKFFLKIIDAVHRAKKEVGTELGQAYWNYPFKFFYRFILANQAEVESRGMGGITLTHRDMNKELSHLLNERAKYEGRPIQPEDYSDKLYDPFPLQLFIPPHTRWSDLRNYVIENRKEIEELLDHYREEPASTGRPRSRRGVDQIVERHLDLPPREIKKILDQEFEDSYTGPEISRIKYEIRRRKISD